MRKKILNFKFEPLCVYRPGPNVPSGFPPYNIIFRFSWNNSDHFSPEHPKGVLDTQNIALLPDRENGRFICQSGG